MTGPAHSCTTFELRRDRDTASVAPRERFTEAEEEDTRRMLHTRDDFEMGYLVYGAGTEYEIEDRVPAHLKIAVVAKLRLQESFLLSWTVSHTEGSGRVSLWLSPSTPLQFRFFGSRPPELNRQWLQALAYSAHGMRGMILIAEDEVDSYLEGVERS